MLVGETLDVAVGCYRHDLRTLFALSSILVIPLFYASARVFVAARVVIGTVDDTRPLLLVLRLFLAGLAVQAFGAAAIPVVTARLSGGVLGIAGGLRALGGHGVEVVLLTFVHVVVFSLSQTAVSSLFVVFFSAGFPVVVMGYVIGLLLGVATVAVITPISLTLPALVNEPVSLGRALLRSLVLTKGSRVRILVVLLVCNLLVYSVTAGIGVVSRMAPGALPSALLQVVRLGLVALVIPVTPAALAVMYRQLRIHREGMDLVLLQQHMGG